MLAPYRSRIDRSDDFAPKMEGPMKSTVCAHLTHKSVGQYNAKEWLAEGDHLLRSAKLMRAIWAVKRRRSTATLSQHVEGRRMSRIWADIEGPPKASILLLAYAVEMYLKAGLAKAYLGCSEDMFDRDVRTRFSHNLLEIAHEIAFTTSDKDKTDLRLLQEMILSGARYPIKERLTGSYMRQRAERVWQVWNKPEFTRMRLLAIRARRHAANIDMDNYDPAVYQSHQIDSDGYLAFRCGGRLPPRITFRVSTEQRASGQTALSDIRKFIDDSVLYYPLRFWDYSLIQEDRIPPAGRAQTILLQRPDRTAPRWVELDPNESEP